MNKNLQIVYFVLSIIGMVDAYYLVLLHYEPGACLGQSQTLFGLSIDCGYVLRSEYSKIGSIPIAFFGLMYYLMVFLSLYFDKQIINQFNKRQMPYTHLHVIFILTSIGLLFTSVLLFLLFFIIKVICSYCLISAITTITLFILTFREIKKMK
ncbi:MAG: vitamin K epoxide reductase family protein [Candidatus Heimdallarchaeota archaeon]|nr:vitamin K epoxide reductase family protein [Candidatus Heimdallarchaeota archaeon]MDH5644917.1 vitamin K epoxide reductase family protein [Candidatus Heimdallarchaeota archaeon]